MKRKSELAAEIEITSKLKFEYIDWVETFDGEFEETYYVTDPSKNRMKCTMKLVIITSPNGNQSYVASVGMTQIPSMKFHTHDDFLRIVYQQEEIPLSAQSVREGSFKECVFFADTFLYWWTTVTKNSRSLR